jgi:dihydrofolate reductase
MSRVRVHNFSVSLDGFGTGEGQSLEAPFGHAGTRLMEWFFPTRTFRTMQGEAGGSTGIDDAFASNWGPGIGAEIMGRNKFGPQRGPWSDEAWDGWWGDDPPFHTPVFIVTHHAREPVTKKGGTTFVFVTDGIESALEQARAAAGGKDVALGGGARVAQQYLKAGLIDEIQLHIVPILLGEGARLFDNLEGSDVSLECTRVVEAPDVTHLTYRFLPR